MLGKNQDCLSDPVPFIASIKNYSPVAGDINEIMFSHVMRLPDASNVLSSTYSKFTGVVSLKIANPWFRVWPRQDKLGAVLLQIDGVEKYMLLTMDILNLKVQKAFYCDTCG